MKIPYRYILTGHILIGLLMGFILNLGIHPQDDNQRQRPFTTQDKMLAVTIRFKKDAPPEVVKTLNLEQGRITIMQPGDCTLTMLDAGRKSLYSLSFRVVFMLPGEPPTPADETYLTFVLPDLTNARWLEISTPQGKTLFDLSIRKGTP